MQLKSFHVRLFRNVIDSGEIKIDSNTCLVGKNEAGKSTMIEALHRLNPAKPAAKLVLLDDYPRWLYKAHDISGELADAVPITATFELSADEFSEVEKQYGKGVLTSKEVVASRKYGGEMELKFSIDFAAFIKTFVAQHAATLKGKLKAATTDELQKELAQLSTEVANGSSEPTPDAQAAKNAKTELDKVLGAGVQNLTEALKKMFTPRVPKTFYFSQYSQLRGRYNMGEVIPALTNPSNDEEVQAAADFLKLAKITPTNVEAWDWEQSNAELESISSLLSKKVKDNWKQNPHLKLHVKTEVQNDKQRWLRFRVEDQRHDFTSQLDRRSTGFRWFVSFIASFFEFEKDKNLILLLDEPGLSLHARAQLDLLESIDTNLTKGRQVIYTTHSPFMVRTEKLDRVRIVEDAGPEHGAKVTNDAGVISDPDTLFPLQAALGYDIAQHLFIGNRNIIIEGISDFIYLSTISTHLRALTRAALPVDCRLIPAGGATNIPTFIALIGDKLDLVVLIDGSAARQKIENAIAAGRLTASRVLTVDRFSKVKDADIEDLFETSEYIDLYNSTLKKKVKESSLKGSDRIVKRIEREEGEFDHGEVAAYFLANHTKIIPTLSASTLDRFEKCIDALAKALPAKKTP